MAGKALELYYMLAEAEAKRDILNRSVKEIDPALSNGERMRAQGLKVGDEFDALYRQRVETLASALELDLGIEKLNGELQHLLKTGPRGESWRNWPEADWKVFDQTIDVPAAIALGMTHRPDLIMLRRLTTDLNRDTAPAVRSVLGRVDALLGMGDDGRHANLRLVLALLGHLKASPEEVASICRQLNALRIEREQATAEEIRIAALTVQGRARQVALGRQEVANWQTRLDEIKARAAKGIGDFTESTNAQLKLLQTQATLVGQVMAWNIARVKLAQAQGLLAEECGLSVSCPEPPASP